ncbi:MAG: FecR domain-containing protein [Endomicrobiales bacterium]|nr:FecR domain-containing protein [Endomicrobiales bacterium]
MKKRSVLNFTKLFLLTFLFPFLFAGIVASGDDYHVGCIDDMRGDVQIYKASRKLWIPAKKLIPVEEKDVIKTGRLSKCTLLFDDGTAMQLGENSKLELETLKLKKEKELKIQTYEMKINFGTLISLFNRKKVKGAKFKVQTPTAVMAIRGTDFAVKVDGNKTNVGLFEGELAVSNIDGEEVVLTPDQEADVEKGKKPVKHDYLSRVMEKEKRRYQKLKDYVEKVRMKLEERDNYLQDRIKARDKKLEDFHKRREEKLKGKIESKEAAEPIEETMDDSENPAEDMKEELEEKTEDKEDIKQEEEEESK